MKKVKARLLSKKKINKNVFLLTIESNGLTFLPGQFVNIKCSENSDFILRRPFSIFDSNESKFKVLIEIKGKGSLTLSENNSGDEINIIGPLGNGFSIKENSVLLGGGMGMAPLNYLAKKINNATIIAGARNSKSLLTFDIAKNHKILEATDDGSKGYKGSCLDLLLEKLDEIKPAYIYSCGPDVMLDAVIEKFKQSNIKGEISMERFMACGIGVCLSCICKTKYGQKRTCTEGPVFKLEEFGV